MLVNRRGIIELVVAICLNEAYHGLGFFQLQPCSAAAKTLSGSVSAIYWMNPHRIIIVTFLHEQWNQEFSELDLVIEISMINKWDLDLTSVLYMDYSRIYHDTFGC